MAGTMFGEGGQQAYNVYKTQRDIERDAIEDLKLRTQAQNDIQSGLIKELLFLPTVETEADKLARDRSTIDMGKIQSFWNPVKAQLGFSTEDIKAAAQSLSEEQKAAFRKDPEAAKKYFLEFLKPKIMNQLLQKGAQYQQVPVDNPLIGFNLQSPSLGIDMAGLSPVEADRGPASVNLPSPEETGEMVNRGLTLPMATSYAGNQPGSPFFNKAEQDVLGKMIEAEIIRGKSMIGIAKQGISDSTDLLQTFMDALKDAGIAQDRPKKGGGGKKETFDEKLLLKMFGMTKETMVALSGTDSMSWYKQRDWLNTQRQVFRLLKDPKEKERFLQGIMKIELGTQKAIELREQLFGKGASSPTEKPQASNKQLLRDAAQQSKDLKSLMQKMLEENAKKNKK